MENRTKFNLDDSINNWKQSISIDAHFTKENVTELESHLIEEINDLNKLGLTDQEAFIIAKRRIGEVEFLATEYGKINRNVYLLNKLLPYLKGVLFFLALTNFSHLLTTVSVVVSSWVGIDSIYFNGISIGSLLLVSVGVILFGLKLHKNANFNIEGLTRVPLLVGIILISKSLTVFTRNMLISSVGIENFGQLQINLSVYNLLLLIGLLTLACIAFLANKKEIKMALAK